MTVKYQFVKRTVAGETFLVPVGEAARRYNGLFALNGLGDFIWDHLPQVSSEEELAELILAEYDVTPEVAAKDTQEFLDQLRRMEIID